MRCWTDPASCASSALFIRNAGSAERLDVLDGTTIRCEAGPLRSRLPIGLHLGAGRLFFTPFCFSQALKRSTISLFHL